MKTNRATFRRAKRIEWWLIAIACLVVALLLSNQIGTDSARLSNKTARSIFDPLLKLFPNLTEEDYTNFHFFFRKCGHVLVHAAVAFSLLRALWYTFGRKTPAVFLALLIAFCIALFDEIVQIRAPGRVWAVKDIGYNTVGSIIGICLSGITI